MRKISIRSFFREAKKRALYAIHCTAGSTYRTTSIDDYSMYQATRAPLGLIESQRTDAKRSKRLYPRMNCV
jgi:type I site-specific restriction endonuclease